MKLKYPLVLASHSPRRQNMLRELGLEFTIHTVDIAEDYPQSLPIKDIAGFLATKKAEALPSDMNNVIFLTADTIVALDDRILEKPQDEQDAAIMLKMLSGKPHKVYTAICLKQNRNYHTLTECTDVIFNELSCEEIDYYIQHYMPLDKAGAYGIQEWIGMIGIREIRGSYFNVVGLPVNRLYELLRKLDLLEI